jgi:hypothetical protein
MPHKLSHCQAAGQLFRKLARASEQLELPIPAAPTRAHAALHAIKRGATRNRRGAPFGALVVDL